MRASQYRQRSFPLLNAKRLLIGSLLFEMHPGFGQRITPDTTEGISTPIFPIT